MGRVFNGWELCSECKFYKDENILGSLALFVHIDMSSVHLKYL